MFQMDGATFVGRSRTAEDATWPLARTQDDSARGQLHPRSHWPGYAGRLGAIVRANVKPRDLNVAVRGDDERCIEVVVSELPLYYGAQLVVDNTMRSAVTRDGAARVDGIMCINARVDNCWRSVPDHRCRLGDQRAMGPEALEFMEAPPSPGEVCPSWLGGRRWTRLLSVSCAKAFVISFGPGCCMPCLGLMGVSRLPPTCTEQREVAAVGAVVLQSDVDRGLSSVLFVSVPERNMCASLLVFEPASNESECMDM